MDIEKAQHELLLVARFAADDGSDVKERQDG